MRILHVLDHSIPLHSGYTFRTRAILREQRRLGWTTGHVTGGKQLTPASPYPGPEEDVDGLHFYRTPPDPRRHARWPLFDQWAVVTGLSARLDEVIEDFRPELLHAHSPLLNGLAALSAPFPVDGHELRPGFVAMWFEGEETDAATMCERLVFTLEVLLKHPDDGAHFRAIRHCPLTEGGNAASFAKIMMNAFFTKLIVG